VVRKESGEEEGGISELGKKTSQIDGAMALEEASKGGFTDDSEP